MVDVVIIGAGASGLVAAIEAARAKKKVIILEKNAKVGKKLLATGNGRCNITNQRPTAEHYYSQNPKFVRNVLEGYGYQTIKQFFKSIGLELVEAKEGKVFPLSLQASSVVELLRYECESLGIEILCDSLVKDISLDNGLFSTKYTQGIIKSKKLLLATGHTSAPQLGGVEDGLVFASKMGHRIIDGFPTLVQLTSSYDRAYLKRISGVKVESRVTLKCKGRSVTKEGDVLFTNYGISGLAILDISRFVMQELTKKRTALLNIDLMPKMSHEQLVALMKKSLKKKSSKPLTLWMQGFINKKLIFPILEPLNLAHLSVGELHEDREKLVKIAQRVKSFPFEVNGSRGYRGAEVASGGIDTKEVNSETLESKRVKNLYFSGEILDVDGDRGGYNLHFAWATALRVAKAL